MRNEQEQALDPGIDRGFPVLDLLLVSRFSEGELREEAVRLDCRNDGGEPRGIRKREHIFGDVLFDECSKEAGLQSNVIHILEVIECRHWDRIC